MEKLLVIFVNYIQVSADFDLNDTFIAEIDFEAIKNEIIKQLHIQNSIIKKDLSIITPKL